MTDEKKKQVICALLTEPTKARACAVLGIDPRTLYNYMQDSDFMQEYKKVINNMLDATVIELKTAMQNGAVELNNIITNDKETTENKLKAIKIAIECGIKLAESTNDIKTSMFDDFLNF